MSARHFLGPQMLVCVTVECSSSGVKKSALRAGELSLQANRRLGFTLLFSERSVHARGVCACGLLSRALHVLPT